MKRLMFSLTALMFFVFIGCGGNADKIIGTWAIVKSEGKDVSNDDAVTLEFTKDGKLIATMKVQGKELKHESTYKVDGDKLTVTGKGTDGKDEEKSGTIKSISGDTMVLVRDGKETELKKK